jgi:hypothetical protein
MLALLKMSPYAFFLSDNPKSQLLVETWNIGAQVKNPFEGVVMKYYAILLG